MIRTTLLSLSCIYVIITCSSHSLVSMLSSLAPLPLLYLCYHHLLLPLSCIYVIITCSSHSLVSMLSSLAPPTLLYLCYHHLLLSRSFVSMLSSLAPPTLLYLCYHHLLLPCLSFHCIILYYIFSYRMVISLKFRFYFLFFSIILFLCHIIH